MCTIKRENKDERGYKNNENLCMGWGFKMKREREKVQVEYYVSSSVKRRLESSQ